MKIDVNRLLIIILIFLFLSCGERMKVADIAEVKVWHCEYNQIIESDSVIPFVVIEDTVGIGLEFTFSLNNKFWFCKDSMMNYIHQIPVADCFNTKEELIQAWLFVSMYTYHHKPISMSEKHIHIPSMLINSVGYGLCDDMTATLCLIWEEMGYETRINHVTDFHVFPEVFDGNKWLMMDPDYALVLITDKNEIASVEEIKSGITLSPYRSELNTSCFNTAQGFVELYPDYLHDVYSNAVNPQKDNWFTDNLNWENAKFLFPRLSKVEFPVFSDTLANAFMKVTIPGNFRGVVKLPLMIAEIANADYKFLSTIDKNSIPLLDQGTNYLWVDGTNITILAYLNPLLFNFDKVFKFNYYSNIEKLPRVCVSEQSITDEKILSIFLHTGDITYSRQILEALHQKNFLSDHKKLNSIADIIDKIKLILMNERSFDMKRVTQNFYKLDSILSNDIEAKNKFYSSMNESQNLVLAIFMIEHLDTKGIGNFADFYFRNK